MGSLKEVRLRIASVSSTRKITSAMKMVSSAKLKKAQNSIQNFLPYKNALASMLSEFISSGADYRSSLTEQREVKKVAILAITSNSSLCGAFNSNVIKKFKEVMASYPTLTIDQFEFYAIGKKGEEAASKMTCHFATTSIDLNEVLDHPSYVQACALSFELCDFFTSGRFDRVEVVYNHFKSAGVQEVYQKQFLPLSLENLADESLLPSVQYSRAEVEYIMEPNLGELMIALIPKVMSTNLYSMILDSIAAEHAARTTSMQIATENADELVRDLTLQYNKARQTAITNEIIEVTSGANAQV